MCVCVCVCAWREANVLHVWSERTIGPVNDFLCVDNHLLSPSPPQWWSTVWLNKRSLSSSLMSPPCSPSAPPLKVEGGAHLDRWVMSLHWFKLCGNSVCKTCDPADWSVIECYEMFPINNVSCDVAMCSQAGSSLLKAAEKLKLLQQREEMAAAAQDKARLKKEKEEAQEAKRRDREDRERLKEEHRRRFEVEKQRRREEKERRKLEKEKVSFVLYFNLKLKTNQSINKLKVSESWDVFYWILRSGRSWKRRRRSMQNVWNYGTNPEKTWSVKTWRSVNAPQSSRSVPVRSFLTNKV